MPADDLNSLFAGGIAPLYYFFGENTRSIDEALALLSDKLFAGEEADFDCERFDAQTHAPSEPNPHTVLEAGRAIWRRRDARFPRHDCCTQ